MWMVMVHGVPAKNAELLILDKAFSQGCAALAPMPQVHVPARIARKICCSGELLWPMMHPELPVLGVRGVRLSDEGWLKLFALCPKLQSLHGIGSVNVNGLLGPLAQCCHELRELSLGECPLPRMALVADVAANNRGLQYLDLSGCVTAKDQIISEVGRSCPGLKTLNLKDCPLVTDEGLVASAASCTGLRTLALGSNHSSQSCITDQGIIGFSDSCPTLTHLDLSNCTRVTDHGLVTAGASCPGLQHLSVRGCGITDKGIIAATASCPQLQHLDLGMTNISDQALTAVGASCADLQHLSLDMCASVTDNGIIAVAASCPRLYSLQLGNADGAALDVDMFPNAAMIGDKGIMAVAASCSGLRYLSLDGLTDITDQGIMQLRKFGTCLQHLSLNNCGSGITGVGIGA
eukprot:gene6659-6383_t